MKNAILVLGILFGVSAHASIRGFTTSGQELGHVIKLQCGSNMSCSISSGRLLIALEGQPAGIRQVNTQASATTLTAAQCGGTFFNAGAVQVELPATAGVLGCRYTFVTMNASNFDVNPSNADLILTLTNVAGDAIRNATLGNSVTIQAMGGNQWAVVASNGTYTDIN